MDQNQGQRILKKTNDYDIYIYIIEELKAKLASSQEDYQNLLTKMETLGKRNSELTNKVAKLEAISSTPKAHKKISLFSIPKKDASTCIDLLEFDSLTCNIILC